VSGGHGQTDKESDVNKVAGKGLETPVPARGLDAVEFICPRCSGKHWGTYRSLEGFFGPEDFGLCRCGFTWQRALDWLYFHRKADGERFASPGEFECCIGVEIGRLT
jgi:hypothetical protein